MSSQVTFEMIQVELKQVNKRLSLIEDAIGEVLIERLPKVTISKKEREEIKRSIEENEERQLRNPKRARHHLDFQVLVR